MSEHVEDQNKVKYKIFKKISNVLNVLLLDLRKCLRIQTKKGSEVKRLEATWNQVKTDCEHPEKLYEWKLVCQNFSFKK